MQEWPMSRARSQWGQILSEFTFNFFTKLVNMAALGYGYDSYLRWVMLSLSPIYYNLSLIRADARMANEPCAFTYGAKLLSKSHSYSKLGDSACCSLSDQLPV